MFPPPAAIYWRTAPLVVFGCVIVVAVLCLFDDGNPRPLVIGPLLGTVFQQTVLAAAWAALGPGRLLWRLPLSFVWACTMATVYSLPKVILGMTDDPLWTIASILALWLAAQMPLWGAALTLGLRLRHQVTYSPADDHRQRQFGIGQLMIFTAFVGILLGAGRLILSSDLLNDSRPYAVPVTAFLTSAQILMSLPLMFATLLPRHVILGSALSLLFIAGVTAGEVSLFEQLTGISPPNETWLFISINAVSLLWVFLFASAVRWSGYHFGVPVGIPPAAD